VRLLEAWLEAPLFIRGTSGAARLMPTALARSALPELRLGFDHLATALAGLRRVNGSSVLTVTASQAFVAKWLLPRLAGFQAQYPEFEMRLDVSDTIADFATGGVDVGIRYGSGPWPGLNSVCLAGESLTPVCSPALLASMPEMTAPEDIRQHVLIHDATATAIGQGFPGWTDWLRQADVNGDVPARGLQINSSAAVLQAAIAGRGVALGRSLLVMDDLEAGLLVCPFPDATLTLDRGWHIVSQKQAEETPKVSLFTRWLLQQANIAAGCKPNHAGAR